MLLTFVSRCKIKKECGASLIVKRASASRVKQVKYGDFVL